jgi:hypothetical protein
MSDERIIQASVTEVTIEARQAPAGVWEHWCQHEDCKKWGSFGFSTRHGPVWFCGEHREAGEAMPAMPGRR